LPKFAIHPVLILSDIYAWDERPEMLPKVRAQRPDVPVIMIPLAMPKPAARRLSVVRLAPDQADRFALPRHEIDTRLDGLQP
jgi:hypothetical protein